MFKRLFILFILVSLFLFPAAAQDAEPRVAWTFETGGQIWTSPRIADGVVYFGSDDGHFYAVDAASGDLVWQFATESLIRSSAFIGDGVIYFGADNGYLYKLDAATGEEIWRADIGVEIANNLREANFDRADYDYLYSSPVVSDGVVYIGNWKLFAIDAESGEKLWESQACGPVPIIRSSPVVVGGELYFGTECGSLWAVDTTTSEPIWKFDGGALPMRTTPLVVDSTIFLGSRSGFFYAVDAADGTEKWRFSLNGSWVESSAIYQDGIVYVGSSDAYRLYAFDAETGDVVWEFDTGGWAWSSPALENGIIYIGTQTDDENYGHLYAVDAATGEEVWKIQTEMLEPDGIYFSGVVSSPAVEDGVVYFGSLDGNLYAVTANG